MDESQGERKDRPIAKKKEYSEPIRGGVELSQVGNRTFIEVGNTGLALFIDKLPTGGKSYEVHYSPEGRFTAATTAKQKVRNIRILGFALYEFIEWLRTNPDHIDAIGSADIRGTTNKTLTEFLEKFFSKSDNPVISQRTQIPGQEKGENNILNFDLKALAELPQDSPFVAQLRQMHNSAQNIVLNKVVYVPSTAPWPV